MAASSADTLSIAELSSLLSDKISLGQSLLQILSSPEMQAVSGVTKLEKKIRQELKFLQRFSESTGVNKLKKEHLQCSNLQNLSAIVQTLRDTKGAVSVLRPYPLVTNTDEKKVTVDVVGESGERWVKVVARSPKALDLNSTGGNQFGQKSFLDQVSEFAACAKQNKQLFRAPTVVFAFHNGVSQRLADKIRKKGVVVEGEIIPNENGFIEESPASSSSECESDGDDDEEQEEVAPDLKVGGVCDDEGSSQIPVACDTTRLNLDITAMIAYVSALTNGHADHEFTEPILAEQASWERERPVKPVLDRLFGNKKLIWDGMINIFTKFIIIIRLKKDNYQCIRPLRRAIETSENVSIPIPAAKPPCEILKRSSPRSAAMERGSGRKNYCRASRLCQT